MKIKGKTEIEYWITRSKTGKLIRVYRVDARESGDPFLQEKHPFDVPIMVEFTGMAEGIADILEDRDKIRGERDYYEKGMMEERRKASDRFYYESKQEKQRKWWQFWKKDL